MNKPDERQVIRGRELFEQLLEISRRQLAVTEQDLQLESVQNELSQLSRQWEETREQIEQWQSGRNGTGSRSEIPSLLKEELEPIMLDTQQNLEKAAANMQKIMQNTGLTIRTTREHRQASNAYTASDFDANQALFFDKKK